MLHRMFTKEAHKETELLQMKETTLLGENSAFTPIGSIASLNLRTLFSPNYRNIVAAENMFQPVEKQEPAVN